MVSAWHRVLFVLVGPLALPTDPMFWRVGGFFSHVFSYSAALGPFRRATLHAISRDFDKFGRMGEALFTLFAGFGPLFGYGAGVP